MVHHLRFINSDNPTKLRGITATGVVMTEGAFQKEDVLKDINARYDSI